MGEVLQQLEHVVRMEIRPTGLLDPRIEVRQTEGQVQDLLSEITDRVEMNERVLVTVLTIKFAEEVSEYLQKMGVKSHYLHSEIDTIERTEIIKALRIGHIDVIVGINLLREGLDIPEVSLVAIFDADRGGFLRNERSLLQTIGRASRHLHGQVLLYADSVSLAMEAAIRQTLQRREMQGRHNECEGIEARSVQKALPVMGSEVEELLAGMAGRAAGGGKRMIAKRRSRSKESDLVKELEIGAGHYGPGEGLLQRISQPKWAAVADSTLLATGDEEKYPDTAEEGLDADLERLLERMQKEMRQAAGRLEFERAAQLRDRIAELRAGKD